MESLLERANTEGNSRLQRFMRWLDRRRWWLLAAIAAVYVGAYAPHWRPSPDSGDYLIMARSIAEGQGFAHPYGFEVNVAPGLPWLLAGVMAVFGTDAVWAANALILAFGVANIVLVYVLMQLHAGRTTAFAVAMLFGVSETTMPYCVEPIPDVPFVTGLLLLLVGLERLYAGRPRPVASVALALSGIIVMGLMRSVVLTVLAATAAALGWELVRRRRYRLLAGGVVAALAALVAVRVADPNTGIFDLNADERIFLKRLTDDLPETLHHAVTENTYLLFCETYSRAAFGADFGKWANVPFGVLFFCVGLGLARRRPVWGLLVAAFTVQWLLFFVTRRYFLPIEPLLALSWWLVALWVDMRWRFRITRLLAWALLLLWLGFNGWRIGEFIAEQHDERFIELHSDGRFAGLDRVAEVAAERAGPDALIFCELQYGSVLTFWSRRRAQASMPPAAFDGPLYALRPLPADLAEAIASRGWEYGRELVAVERAGEWEAFVLCEVEK